MPTVVTDRNSEAARLARAVDESDKRLDAFRRKRVEFIRHFAGPHYGDNKSEGRQPLNLVYSIATALEPSLALRELRVSVNTRQTRHRAFGEKLRQTLEYVCRKIRAAGALREAVRDSFFGMGVIKTALDGQGEFPFVEPISLDDYVIDHRARNRRPGAYTYEGHRFRMSFQEAMDGGMFGPEERAVIEQMEKTQRDAQNRAAALSGKPPLGEDDWDAQIELVELYMPQRNSVVWLPGTLASPSKYLREVDWYGHEEGPYDTLGYTFVPDNAIPLPIMAVIFDLYLMENLLANKIARQALAQKDFVLAEDKSERDANTIRKVQDGEVAIVSDAKAAQVMSIGGANEKGYQAVGWLHDFLTRIAGNPDIIGGLKAQSQTLGQDQLLAQGAGVRVADMRGFVVDMASSVVQKIAWYVWNDPQLEMDFTQRIARGVELPIRWEPDARDGRLTDYDLSIIVSNRQSDTPEDQYARLRELMSSFVMPLAPLAAQQGSRPDWDLIVNLAGRAADIPEIEDLWVEGMPVDNAPAASVPAQPQQQGMTGPTMRPGQVPDVIGQMATAGMEARQ